MSKPKAPPPPLPPLPPPEAPEVDLGDTKKKKTKDKSSRIGTKKLQVPMGGVSGGSGLKIPN